MKNIILASASPRRKDIFEKFGVKFQIIPSTIDEQYDIFDDPIEVATKLALDKCIDVANKAGKEDMVIAADTIVYYNSILGKPKDREDAFNTIKALSGNTHKVITGLAIIDKKNNKRIVDYEVTKVEFRDLDDNKIKRYLDTEEYVDKAGAYGIQGYGEILVESIEGSFSNVVGLPITKLDKLLEENFEMKIL